MSFQLNPIVMSGREALPLIEGGKGIAISNGESSGAWAATGGIGTFPASMQIRLMTMETWSISRITAKLGVNAMTN